MPYGDRSLNEEQYRCGWGKGVWLAMLELWQGPLWKIESDEVFGKMKMGREREMKI